METKVRTYKDLMVWQKSMNLSLKIYSISYSFPDEEKFGLTSQIRRCSVSVPSNIAEGWGRFSNKSFVQFLKIARGSLFELETQLVIAKELNYIDNINHLEDRIEEISKMIYSLIQKMSDA